MRLIFPTRETNEEPTFGINRERNRPVSSAGRQRGRFFLSLIEGLV